MVGIPEQKIGGRKQLNMGTNQRASNIAFWFFFWKGDQNEIRRNVEQGK